MKHTAVEPGVLGNELCRKIPSFIDDIPVKFRMSNKNKTNRKLDHQAIRISSFVVNVFSSLSKDCKRECASNNDNDLANSVRTSTSENRTIRFTCLGLIYGLLSGFLFSACAASVKYLTILDPGQVAFYQYIGICAFSLPMVVRSGNNLFGPDMTCRSWILLCGVFDALTMYLAFVSFQYLPLSDASVITSSVPVFVTITARIFLKELCGTTQIVAIAISVVGVALVSKVPLLLVHRTEVYTKENVIGILASLGAVATESGVYVLLRKLHNVDVFVILFNFGWVATLITGGLTLIFGSFTYTPCGIHQWLVMAVGVFSFLSQMALTKALELEHAGPVSVLMSAGDVILAFILDAVIFRDHPDVYTISGTFLVITSVVIVGFKKWLDELPKGFSIKNKVINFFK